MKALAIDTSNYMTSVAVVTREGKVLSDLRTPVPVDEGQKGLRQSEALFHHVKNLPALLEKALSISPEKIEGVVVSAQPRNLPESYMPVFLAGVGQARVLAASLDIPCIFRSHQEGHLFAALASSNMELPLPEHFLALHLSGGTSELLSVTRQDLLGNKLKIQLLGASSDLNVGQFVDRVGLALGLPFPAGPGLEKLASDAQGRIRLKTSISGLSPSFSGPCTQAIRLASQGEEASEVAMAVQNSIVKILEKWLVAAYEQTGIREVLLTGGVAANQYIRNRLVWRLAKGRAEIRVYFGRPEYSGDNAVGLAFSYWFPHLAKIRDS